MSFAPIEARLLRAAVGERGPVEPTPDEWATWADAATTERLIPLLARVVSEAPADSLDTLQIESAMEMQLDVMGTVVRFEHDLLEVAAFLRELDCGFAVLKGAATAHLDYDDPAHRQFADIDLLVHPSDFAHVCRSLAQIGWRQAYSLPRHHERFTHAITLRNERRVEVDVHQQIAHRAIGLLVSTEALLASLEEYELAGERLPALAAPDRLIHAALHSLTPRPPYRQLSATADVLVLTRKTDPAEVFERAESFRVRSLVARSIAAAHRAAWLPMPSAWVEPSTREGRRDAWLIASAYRSDRRRPLLEELAYLKVMGAWADRGRYVSGYFRTDPDYAAQHHRSGLAAQVRYLVSRLRSGKTT